MAITVKGYRLLIKPDGAMEKTAGGIILATDKKLEQAAMQRGVVHSVGSRCWENEKEPWAVEGDYVLYSQYAGKVVSDPETNEQFIILNDEDILATIQNADPKPFDASEVLELRRESLNG